MWVCQKSGAHLSDEVRVSQAGDVHPEDKKANAQKAQRDKEAAASKPAASQGSGSTTRASNRG